MNKVFENINRKSFYVSALLLFLIFCAYYFTILYLRIPTDIPVHAQIAYSFVNSNDKLTPNFLYYFLLALFAGFSGYKYAYYIASIIVLSIAIALKFLVNSFYIKKYVPQISSRTTIILSVFLLFIFCLPGYNFSYPDHFYFGQLAPNVWHNSTVIFLFPFCIVLFFKVYELLYSNETNRNASYQVAGLILINALIKPSLLFTIIPSFLLLFLFKNKLVDLTVKELKKLLPFAAGIIFIAVEYFVIYKLNYTSNVTSSNQQAGVVIAPLQVWRHFSSNIPVAIFTSCFFPLVYIFLSKGKVLKNPLVIFALTNFIFGLAIWILFAESGDRKFHGNFYWQVVITNYLLFFSLLLHLINSIKANTIGKTKQFFITGAFLLHFIWGIFYWTKIIIFKGYG